MTQEQLETRKGRAESERFVISLNDEGNFKVYSPAYPSKSYTVSGTPEGPTCTCPDFDGHKDDPDWKCKHMVAVLNLINRSGEPAAAKDDEPKPTKEESVAGTTDALEMHIRRSVSPDGRIDSLSLEFSYPVGNASPDEIKESAERLLGVLSDIAAEFKEENGKTTEARKTEQPSGDGSVHAQMLSVGGMPGRWGGRRLFLNFEVNGQTVKLFGSRNELARYLVYAGFPNLAERLAEGMTLNLPCRVVTKPSDDGRYTNIEKVFPIEALRLNRSPAK